MEKTTCLRVAADVELLELRGYLRQGRDGFYVAFEAQADMATYLGGILTLFDHRRDTVEAALRHRTRNSRGQILVTQDLLEEVNQPAMVHVREAGESGNTHPYINLYALELDYPLALLAQTAYRPYGQNGRFRLQEDVSRPIWHYLSEGRGPDKRVCHSVLVSLTSEKHPLVASHTNCFPAERGMDTLVFDREIRETSWLELVSGDTVCRV